MATYWTWAQIKTKLQAELDLQDEDFIPESELLGYTNEAIKEAEAEIHALYEDYFISFADITFDVTKENYDLPTDIYAMKLRAIIYNSNGQLFPIKRFTNWNKFRAYLDAKNYAQGEDYACLLVNKTAGSPQLYFQPVPKTGAKATVWYLRCANVLADDADICDIPEFIAFITKYVKMRCYEKEGNPNLATAQAELLAERQTMVSTLAGMVVDNENEIEADFSHYMEHT